MTLMQAGCNKKNNKSKPVLVHRYLFMQAKNMSLKQCKEKAQTFEKQRQMFTLLLLLHLMLLLLVTFVNLLCTLELFNEFCNIRSAAHYFIIDIITYITFLFTVQKQHTPNNDRTVSYGIKSLFTHLFVKSDPRWYQ